MKTKREFEMHCAAMIMAQAAVKDGTNYPANIAQDRAQELADALERRGFFAEESEGKTERYRTPQPRRQQPAVQEMMVEER